MLNSLDHHNRKLLNELADGFVVEVPQYEEELVEDWELDAKDCSLREIHFKGALFSYGTPPNFFSIPRWLTLTQTIQQTLYVSAFVKN